MGPLGIKSQNNEETMEHFDHWIMTGSHGE
jgi:hypothetical protein